MTEENKAPEAAEAMPQAAEPPAEAPAEAPAAEASGTPKDEPPKVEWKFKRNLGINEEMKKVIGLTIEASNAEIASLRRKLEKLTYGA